MMTADELIAFEDDIAREFEAGKIHAPIHLSGNNETQLIDYFSKNVRPQDWIFTSWRSHYHALLHGVPPAEVKQAIMSGHSISLCFPQYRVFSSAIVGGIAPIALGVAQHLQWYKEMAPDIQASVHVFLGDMSVKAGIVREAMEYSDRHRLGVNWIIEDNSMSICTPTMEAWGTQALSSEMDAHVHYYRYKMERPHVGIGQFVRF